jgi:proteasome lid subunit RPN8/RPN11
LDLLDAAKNMYPKEYASLLGGEEKEQILSEFVVPPVISDEHSASINLWAIPSDESIVGSVHSHPNGNGHASSVDKKMFTRYSINLILYYPFELNNFIAYNSDSKIVEIMIIE